MRAASPDVLKGVLYHHRRLWTFTLDAGKPVNLSPRGRGANHSLLGQKKVSITYNRESACLSFSRGKSFVFETPGSAVVQSDKGPRILRFPLEALPA